MVREETWPRDDRRHRGGGWTRYPMKGYAIGIAASLTLHGLLLCLGWGLSSPGTGAPQEILQIRFLEMPLSLPPSDRIDPAQRQGASVVSPSKRPTPPASRPRRRPVKPPEAPRPATPVSAPPLRTDPPEALRPPTVPIGEGPLVAMPPPATVRKAATERPAPLREPLDALPLGVSLPVEAEPAPAAPAKKGIGSGPPKGEPMSGTGTPTAAALGTGGETKTGGEGTEGENPPPAAGGDEGVEEAHLGDPDAPTFLHRERPLYPHRARRLGKEGKVLLRLSIDRQGRLVAVEIIEGASHGFTEAALAAVRRSTFAPARRGGKAVDARAILSVRFRLEGP